MNQIPASEEQPTAEEVARYYSAAMDSVKLINAGRPFVLETVEGVEVQKFTMNEIDWTDCVARNKEHLKIMLAKDFWTTEDLTPIEAAAT